MLSTWMDKSFNLASKEVVIITGPSVSCNDMALYTGKKKLDGSKLRESAHLHAAPRKSRRFEFLHEFQRLDMSWFQTVLISETAADFSVSWFQTAKRSLRRQQLQRSAEYYMSPSILQWHGTVHRGKKNLVPQKWIRPEIAVLIEANLSTSNSFIYTYHGTLWICNRQEEVKYSSMQNGDTS